MSRRELAAGLTLGALLGALAVWGAARLGSGGPSSGPAAAEDAARGSAAQVTELEGRVQELADRLAREESRRRDLEQRLAALTRSGDGAPQDSAPTPTPDEDAGSAKPEVPRDFVDTAVLARAGFSPSEVDELRARFEAIELERLYLRDQATREGWIGKPRFRQRVRELEDGYDAMQQEYGADAYDWILFASGRPNRVVVRRVMQGSEAEAAGFREGDLVLRYEGEPIFDVRTLQQATTQGRLGDTTSVEVERDGEQIRLYPARGPLGVGLGVLSREPAHPAF